MVRGAWQHDHKPAARAGSAFNLDRAVQPPHDALDGRKAEPSAHRSRREEGIEDPRPRVGGHPGPVSATSRQAAGGPFWTASEVVMMIEPGLPSRDSEALITRFMTSCRISEGLAQTGGRSGSEGGFERHRL